MTVWEKQEKVVVVKFLFSFSSWYSEVFNISHKHNTVKHNYS